LGSRFSSGKRGGATLAGAVVAFCSWAAYDRGVDTQVMRLRKKIEAEPSNPSLIKTVRGSGYVFAAAVTVD
jgi:DNA-binding response OmpR family regulator